MMLVFYRQRIRTSSDLHGCRSKNLNDTNTKLNIKIRNIFGVNCCLTIKS
jgi:hypothetical protein